MVEGARGARLEDNSEKIGHVAPTQGGNVPRARVQSARTSLRVFRKAINKVNESFQTHNGGAIIERRMLSAGAEASGHLLFTQVFLACI